MHEFHVKESLRCVELLLSFSPTLALLAGGRSVHYLKKNFEGSVQKRPPELLRTRLSLFVRGAEALRLRREKKLAAAERGRAEFCGVRFRFPDRRLCPCWTLWWLVVASWREGGLLVWPWPGARQLGRAGFRSKPLGPAAAAASDTAVG